MLINKASEINNSYYDSICVIQAEGYYLHDFFISPIYGNQYDTMDSNSIHNMTKYGRMTRNTIPNITKEVVDFIEGNNPIYYD